MGRWCPERKKAQKGPYGEVVPAVRGMMRQHHRLKAVGGKASRGSKESVPLKPPHLTEVYLSCLFSDHQEMFLHVHGSQMGTNEVRQAYVTDSGGS